MASPLNINGGDDRIKWIATAQNVEPLTVVGDYTMVDPPTEDEILIPSAGNIVNYVTSAFRLIHGIFLIPSPLIGKEIKKHTERGIYSIKSVSLEQGFSIPITLLSRSFCNILGWF